jgi:pyruvate,water dikinase
MKLFSKGESCRLLADPEGPAAARYRHYAAFLEHNHRALALQAELELLDRGAGFATALSVARRVRELLAAVRGMLDALEGIAPGRYADLAPAFERVARELAPLLVRERPAIEGPLALPFSALAAAHLGLAGAKAVNLARARNELGLPAPDGFVVTTAGSDRFLRENRLLEPIEAMLGAFDPDDPENDARCREVQDRIRAAPLPESLAAAVDAQYRELSARAGGAPLVAVRSSAVGEDTAASFAGQYRSVLSVPAAGVAAAFREVLASKYAPAAVVYRLRYGLTDAATPMAAAVVAMIRARASGVLFTLDPGRPSGGRARIDAVLGPGEQVVGGSATPDVFLVDRERLAVVESRIRPKAGGAGRRPAVAAEALARLAAMGLALERLFGGPQDVEWVEDEGGSLFILQARPLAASEGGGGERPAAIDLTRLAPILAGGETASPGRVSGRAVRAAAGLAPAAVENAILVARTAAPELAPLLGRARGLITDFGGAASHLASVARECRIPALVGTGEATAKIADGEEITLCADEAAVYRGLVPELARRPPASPAADERGPIGGRLRALLDRIAPLNLTDPAAPEFTPAGCRTLHDLIRFAHEKATAEMFYLSELAGGSVVSRRMSANLPLAIHFVDLGGGLEAGLTTCDEIRPEHIRSRPMAALWRGLSHPGVTWSGTVELSGRNLLALMAGSIGPENAAPPRIDSYALVSGDYLNLSVKFGYHYANIDARLTDEPGGSGVALQFAGGAGTAAGKALRIEFLAAVLSRLGFVVEVRGEALRAEMRGLDAAAAEAALDQTGRLLGASRLLDLAIPSRAEVEALTELFFKGEYDFLGRSETRLPGYYASVGDWFRQASAGGEVIVQDGAAMTGTVACTLHHTLERVLGGRYRRFLEERHARHYTPTAVKRDSRRGDGRIRLAVRIAGGCVDLAAGVAFGWRRVGNCLVLAADAAAGELQLLVFVDHVRGFLARAAAPIPVGRWLELEVAVAGARVTGALEGRVLLEATLPLPVEGFVGLWSKGDTTAHFRGLAAFDPEERGAAR